MATCGSSLRLEPFPPLSGRLSFVFLLDLAGAGGTVQGSVRAWKKPGPTPDTVFAGRIPDDLCLQGRIQGENRMFHPSADKMIVAHLLAG